ncbi:NUDIX hydrolase [Candidatus Gracilibacteria bacterium]|nr:NUDIX hydrolase [Candidatus Gracilibacteria bacterium]
MEPKIGVATFVIRTCVDNVEFLIGKRINDKNHSNNVWCLPGGGVNFKEDPKNASIRETREEFGIEIEVPKILVPYIYSSNLFGVSEKEQHYITLFFVSHIIDNSNPEIMKEIDGKKHSEWKWVTIEECKTLELFDHLRLIISNDAVCGFLRGYKNSLCWR